MHRRLPDPLFEHVRFLVGPTASGKSTVAMRLAEASQSTRPLEILALDSMTLYRGFDIGTAKPTPEDRARVPHHFVDVLGPLDGHTVADYVDAAVTCCEAIVDRGCIPLFVGGSGMFLRAMLRGLFEGPPSDPVVRADLEAEAMRVGEVRFHRMLEEIDPESAAKIHPNDVRRVVRAREVFMLTGQTLSSMHREDARQDRLARCIWLDGPRDWMHERINHRVQVMIDDGWVEEAQRLLALDPEPGTVFWKMLGYDILAEHLRGDRSLDSAIEAIQIATRQFAKRQVTWFRNLDECQPLSFARETTLDQLVHEAAVRLELPTP